MDITTRALIVSAIVSLLVSAIMGLWFYPDRKLMARYFAISFLLTFPCMLAAMVMPL